ncbi:hypothetical protein [Longimicrobium sp.]|uniref:hypothetical protein n=1 Tax=Longimicrobium sp. TaxID=2029185 RepID=UPI003B3A62AA
MSFQDLYTDTKKTSALGFHPAMAVTQNGNWDPQLNALVQLATQFGFGGDMADARDFAFQDIPGLPLWTKGEATGIHAEVLIIRAWLAQEILENHQSVHQAIAALRGREIYASQPACWCCARLMSDWRIVYDAAREGHKPLTGWRHPLAAQTTPNTKIPATARQITSAWIAQQAP